MTPNIFPALRYADAAAALDWLTRAFGFERHDVHTNKDGTIGHAEIKLGPGIVMMGQARDDAFKVKPPKQLGGFSSATIYVYVADPDKHYTQAKAAGAEIVRELENTEYGSREYSCRDPEGHFWSFGTYQPKA
jgi:uncharacterized glyoxalase superfamily protein PhnB